MDTFRDPNRESYRRSICLKRIEESTNFSPRESLPRVQLAIPCGCSRTPARSTMLIYYSLKIYYTRPGQRAAYERMRAVYKRESDNDIPPLVSIRSAVYERTKGKSAAR